MTIEAWPKNGLEYLGKCPVCGYAGRTLLHDSLHDRLFGAPGLWTMYRCHGCRSGYLDPRPNQKTIALAYRSYGTHESASVRERTGLARLRVKMRNGYLNKRYGYNQQPASTIGYWVMQAMPAPIRSEWDHFARNLPQPGGQSNCLLDVGCGNGQFLIAARDAGWDVTGTEPDPVAAAQVVANGIPIHVGAYESATFAKSSFDVITANQVLEHVHDPLAFVRKMHDWLRPGGLLWIGTPNIESPLHERFGSDYLALHPPYHLVVLNKNSLLDLIEAAGLSPRSFFPHGMNEYNEFKSSAGLAKGLTGNEVNYGVKNLGKRELLLGLYHEFRAWISKDSCSDLVLLCEKPVDGQPAG